MRGTVTRVRRKLRSDGYLHTLRSIWKEIYLIKFLTYTPKVRNYLYKKFSPTEVNKQAHVVAELSTNNQCQIQIPDKVWISGDMPVNEAKKYRIPSPKIHIYKNCYLFAPPGLGMTETGKVIPNTVASELAWKRNRNKTFLSRLIYEHGLLTTQKMVKNPDKITQFDFDRLFPIYPFWHNYFHWTAECLPKLLWVKKDDVAIGDDVVIGIPPDPPQWMTESLELLGIQKYHELNHGLYTAKELIVPSGPEPAPQECEWFRSQSLSNLNLDKKVSNRVYVSRENANRRRVTNRDEIMEQLSDYGFKSYVLEDLSVREQATLFANAEIVVGPHGAGFANLMYSRDTAVIELFGSRKKLTYYRLSKLLDFEYEAIIGEEQPPDIRVDAEKVCDAVKRVLNSPE